MPRSRSSSGGTPLIPVRALGSSGSAGAPQKLWFAAISTWRRIDSCSPMLAGASRVGGSGWRHVVCFVSMFVQYSLPPWSALRFTSQRLPANCSTASRLGVTRPGVSQELRGC